MTGSARRRVAVVGQGVWSTGNLAALLDDCELLRMRSTVAADWAGVEAVLAWGNKPSAVRAGRIAARHGLPLLRIEDGFLRSVGLGADTPPLSLVFDDLGIYYDARSPSRLEALVRDGVSAAQAARAEELRARWCAARVSKYNAARDGVPAGGLPARYVLVVDQTAGDVSISGGLADASCFSRMLAAALAEYPQCAVVLKVHPDVVAGRKRGHFDLRALAADPRIRVLADDLHPALLIERAEAVYTVTSQLGFEGLLHGKPVHVFGMPFYAGWGLTRDALPVPPRRGAATLAALVHAALIAYPRYVDPETSLRCEPERLLDWMALQRQQRGRLPARIHARGFSLRKRPLLRRFLAGSEVEFVGRGRAQPGGTPLAVWGRPPGPGTGLPAGLIMVEDGFLRSVGLGADLVAPLSWVFDDAGIYFDATRPSRLENILQDADIDAALCARAAAIAATIRANGITKYNLDGRQWQRPAGARRVILVPGQVETDASIAWGAPGIFRNIDLLRAVRAENPDAWIVYKPHPDVVAGLRKRGTGEAAAADFCDEIVVDAPMHGLLDQVDEVHVLTSLAGFEALLRGRAVTCWGQPFYAGWGLTQDRMPVARRTRRRTLDELVAATLVLYPTYVSRDSGAYTTPERALLELARWRAEGAAPVSAWWRVKRTLMRLRARWSET